MAQELSQKEAEDIFRLIAKDKRFTHAYNANNCFHRRELIIGIMLHEMGVPPGNIGRLTLVPQKINGRGDILIQLEEMADFLKKKPYMNEGELANLILWHCHGVPTLRYRHSREGIVDGIMDHSYTPLRLSFRNEFVDFFMKRLVEKKPISRDGKEYEFVKINSPLIHFHSSLGAFPQEGFSRTETGDEPIDIKSYLTEGSRIYPFIQMQFSTINGTVSPSGDWPSLDKRQADIQLNALKEYFEYKTREASRDGLSGEGFVEKFAEFDNWSKGPQI